MKLHHFSSTLHNQEKPERPWQKAILKPIHKKGFESPLLVTDVRGYLYESEYSEEEPKAQIVGDDEELGSTRAGQPTKFPRIVHEESNEFVFTNWRSTVPDGNQWVWPRRAASAVHPGSCRFSSARA